MAPFPGRRAAALPGPARYTVCGQSCGPAPADPDAPAQPTNEGTRGRTTPDAPGRPASPDELAEAWHRYPRGAPAQPTGLAAHQRAGTLHESTAIVAVPNDFTRGQVEGRLRGQLEDALSDAFGREIRIAVTVTRRWTTTAPDGVRRTSINRQVHKTLCRQWGHVSTTEPPVSPSRRSPRTDVRARRRAGRGPGAPGDGDPAQPEVHLRDLRHRLLQPLPARRGGRGVRGAGQGLQPAAGLRRLRPRQDPPPARDRPLRAQPLHRRPGALRVERGVHQRVHQRDPRRPAGPVQAPLPRRRRAAHRRHPVPGGEDPDAGGVLPHLQHAPQRQQADRAHLRPRPQAARGARGPAPQPVRVGPDHRRPAARPRDPDRDPAQEGRDGPALGAGRTCSSSSPPRSRPTSASSRAR